jgi:hypothetical protein
VGYVSVIHAAPASCAARSALTPGFVAAAQDSAKQRAYRRYSSALPLVPLSVESFGQFRALAVLLLGSFSHVEVQAGGPGLSRPAFISWALRGLSVALCQGNASLCRLGLYIATAASGQAPLRVLSRPSIEVA